ncbi:hypothetical protein M409DRAFT_56133 [Zasmidium cellare ATCC 36951]|uniref:Uncharacterized protein n=1 Tax=Zasmidium cellare ATCC 36951 TaxID=1080233 RepID=A0A6A6CIN7_ZASCE|nr:uncharacterized protein M409DRAFT_56133 [Zasmidium cellare ATCC 36951]KAF2165266.1 hypothetical protein M409DRAFT_56133 [Zasmidium cellare ATCC 36951]
MATNDPNDSRDMNYENDQPDYEDCHRCILKRLDCDWDGHPRHSCTNCRRGGNSCRSLDNLLNSIDTTTENARQLAPQRTVGTNDYNGQGFNPHLPSQVIYQGPTYNNGLQYPSGKPHRPNNQRRNTYASTNRNPRSNPPPVAQTKHDLSQYQMRDIRKHAWDLIRNSNAKNPKLDSFRAEPGKSEYLDEYVQQMRSRDGIAFGSRLSQVTKPNIHQGHRQRRPLFGQGAPSQLRDTVNRNHRSNREKDLEDELESWKYKARMSQWDKQMMEKEVQMKYKELHEVQRALSRKNIELGIPRKSQKNKGKKSRHGAKRQKIDDEEFDRLPPSQQAQAIDDDMEELRNMSEDEEDPRDIINRALALSLRRNEEDPNDIVAQALVFGATPPPRIEEYPRDIMDQALALGETSSDVQSDDEKGSVSPSDRTGGKRGRRR